MNKEKYVKLPGKQGFTLIELLIAMTIAGIVTAAVFSAFQSQQRSSVIQENVNLMQQNLRGAMEIMIKDIRMAGYGTPNVGGVGIIDVQPRGKGVVNPPPDYDNGFTGNGAIQLSADFNDNGVLDPNETITYSIFDSPVGAPDQKPDLAREVGGGGRQLLAENIEALGFAYAFDADGDGSADTYRATGIPDPPAPAPPLTAEERRRIIWAIDSNLDNRLDRNLDTNLDGVIDANDDADNNGLIDGIALNDFDGNAIAPVDPADIQAVRIWMLARTDRQDNRFLNRDTYTVGNKVITPANDAIDGDPGNNTCRMRLLETIVRCRNLEF